MVLAPGPDTTSRMEALRRTYAGRAVLFARREPTPEVLWELRANEWMARRMALLLARHVAGTGWAGLVDAAAAEAADMGRFGSALAGRYRRLAEDALCCCDLRLPV